MTRHAPQPEIHLDYESRRQGIRLVLLNRGDLGCTFRLESNAHQHRSDPLSFRVGPRDDRDVFLALKHSANWYDFTVRVVGNGAYSRRFAGRLENGRHLRSDPAMGGRAIGAPELRLDHFRDPDDGRFRGSSSGSTRQSSARLSVERHDLAGCEVRNRGLYGVADLGRGTDDGHAQVVFR